MSDLIDTPRDRGNFEELARRAEKIRLQDKRIAELEAERDDAVNCHKVSDEWRSHYQTDNERLRAALHRIALYKNHEPAKDFTHCVQIARYALYPELREDD